ncbi:MAG: hypothetical protein IPJ84_16105 [Bdellovibrionales bacterium]|nr:hypothetical protein [Bdellovibrionales bacterium]
MSNETWWGRTSLRIRTAQFWQIGSLDLLIERTSSEFSVSWRHATRTTSSVVNAAASGPTVSKRHLSNPSDAAAIRSAPSPASPLSPFIPAPFQTQAFAMPTMQPSPSDDLIFTPVLPQAPLAVYFATPLTLEPNEKLTFGVCLPLEIKIESGGSRVICAVPLEPFSKTWFGPNALYGELALSINRTTVYSALDETHPRADQARAALTVRNVNGTPLTVDRVLIPCSRLSLFHSPQTGFWTDSITIDARGDEHNSFQSDRSLPREAGPSQFIQLVANPRAQERASINELALKNFKNFFKERG